MRRVLLVLLAGALMHAPAAGAWSWPVEGPLLRPFVFGDNPYAGGQHRGVDVAAEQGGVVAAPVPGTVSFAGTVPGGGRTVTIQTADGYSVTLVHLGAISVTRGATVLEGAPVGLVGPSGVPEWDEPYVHMGVRVTADGHGYVDPLLFLPSRDERLGVPAEVDAVPADSHGREPVASPSEAEATPEVADSDSHVLPAVGSTEAGGTATVDAGADASVPAETAPAAVAGEPAAGEPVEAGAERPADVAPPAPVPFAPVEAPARPPAAVVADPEPRPAAPSSPAAPAPVAVPAGPGEAGRAAEPVESSDVRDRGVAPSAPAAPAVAPAAPVAVTPVAAAPAAASQAAITEPESGAEPVAGGGAPSSDAPAATATEAEGPHEVLAPTLADAATGAPSGMGGETLAGVGVSTGATSVQAAFRAASLPGAAGLAGISVPGTAALQPPAATFVGPRTDAGGGASGESGGVGPSHGGDPAPAVAVAPVGAVVDAGAGAGTDGPSAVPGGGRIGLPWAAVVAALAAALGCCVAAARRRGGRRAPVPLERTRVERGLAPVAPSPGCPHGARPARRTSGCRGSAAYGGDPLEQLLRRPRQRPGPTRPLSGRPGSAPAGSRRARRPPLAAAVLR